MVLSPDARSLRQAELRGRFLQRTGSQVFQRVRDWIDSKAGGFERHHTQDRLDIVGGGIAVDRGWAMGDGDAPLDGEKMETYQYQ